MICQGCSDAARDGTEHPQGCGCPCQHRLAQLILGRTVTEWVLLSAHDVGRGSYVGGGVLA